MQEGLFTVFSRSAAQGRLVPGAADGIARFIAGGSQLSTCPGQRRWEAARSTAPSPPAPQLSCPTDEVTLAPTVLMLLA